MALSPDQLQYVKTLLELLKGKMGFELLPQRCFLNAMALTECEARHSAQRRIQYWEGHLNLCQKAQEQLGVSKVPHAWITVDGVLYDPTVEPNRLLPNAPPEECEDAYQGRLIPLTDVRKAWKNLHKTAIDPELQKEVHGLAKRYPPKPRKGR